MPEAAATLVHWDLPAHSRKVFSLRLLPLLPAMRRRQGLQVRLLLGPAELGRPLASLLPWLARSSPPTPALLAAGRRAAQAPCVTMAEQGRCGRPGCLASHEWGVERTGGVPDVGDEVQFEVSEVVSAVTYWVRMAGVEEDKAAARRRLRMAVYYGGKVATREEVVELGREVAVVRGDVCRAQVTGLGGEEEHTAVQG